jgi:hypothetical protein
MIPDFTVSTFRGLNTFIKDLKTLKPGVASSSNDWITGKYGDHIELRRRTQLLDQTRQTRKLRSAVVFVLAFRSEEALRSFRLD